MQRKDGSHLSLPLQGSQQPIGYRGHALLHRLLAKPPRLVSVSHDAGMGCYCWQHAFLDEPVDPFWIFCCADILTPAVVGMGSKAMDGDNAGRINVSFDTQAP